MIDNLSDFHGGDEPTWIDAMDHVLKAFSATENSRNSSPRRKSEKRVATKCLKCGKVFGSVDRKANRICSRCKRDNRRREDRSEGSCGSVVVNDGSMNYLNEDPIPSDLDPLNYPKAS